MSRQSISLTESNNDWLKSQIKHQEYNSKSEAVNDLVRKARLKQAKTAFIQNKLDQAEKLGFTSKTQNEILTEIKQEFVK